MKIENDETHFRVIFSERERRAGLIDILDQKLPKFGCFYSQDMMEWHIENRHRDAFTRLVNKHFNNVQLSLF